MVLLSGNQRNDSARALPAGTYYIVLDGSGNMNTDNYGSLGSYTLNGFKSALPIRDVTLNGQTDRQTQPELDDHCR